MKSFNRRVPQFSQVCVSEHVLEMSYVIFQMLKEKKKWANLW